MLKSKIHCNSNIILMVLSYLLGFECIDDSENSEDDASCSNQGYCSNDKTCECNSNDVRKSKFGGKNCSGKFYFMCFHQKIYYFKH